MKPVIAALAILGAVACASSGVDRRLEYTYNGSVTGVIVMPEATSGSNACSNIAVVATVDNQEIGRSAIRPSKNRCSYQIDNLPADKEVTVKVVPASDLKCQDGSPVAFVSDVQTPFKLDPNQGKLADFRAQCGGTQS